AILVGHDRDGALLGRCRGEGGAMLVHSADGDEDVAGTQICSGERDSGQGDAIDRTAGGGAESGGEVRQGPLWRSVWTEHRGEAGLSRHSLPMISRAIPGARRADA